jgi:Tol biopolymer transport system component
VFIAADSRNTEMWETSVDGSGLRRLVSGVPLLRDPVFGPDGRTLYACAVPQGGNPTLLRYRLGPSGSVEGSPEPLASFPVGRIRHLAVSRDGRRIVYSMLNVASNIWQVPVDPRTGARTGPARALTAETGRMTRPDFSPDGARIAFSRYRLGTSDDLFVMDADGKGSTRVTSSVAAESWPSWFPDGKRIAFFSDRRGRPTYWWHDLSDGSEGLLLDPGFDFDAPRMSHDGRRVAWNSRRGGRLNVWLADMDNGPQSARQVTFDTELMGWPCWSPDGKLLAVQARRGNGTQLAVVSPDGGTPEILVSDEGQSWPSGFAPDGERIVFAGQRGGLWNLYTVSRTSREVTKLTDFGRASSYVRYGVWSPRGDRIAFEYAENAGNVWLIELPR